MTINDEGVSMIRDLYLQPGQLAAAQVDNPPEGELEQPKIEFKVRLNRFQQTGATVSVAAAQELIAALQAAVKAATASPDSSSEEG